MNHDTPELSSLAAWEVETTDLTGRVRSAIGGYSPLVELLEELRAVRQELAELRHGNLLLQDDIVRLRLELAGRPNTRITPYAPTEGFIRLA